MIMPKITVSNVTYKYLTKDYEILALDNISLAIKPGINNVIIGASGCGKTTLLKAILGAIDYEGDIFFGDVNVNMKNAKDRKCSYVNQDIALYPHLPIFNNIAFPLQLARFKEDEIRYRVNKISKEFGISQCLSRLPREISIGQAQRASICKALVKSSDVYIFDEAFSNLDRPNTVLCLEKINKVIQDSNVTKIFVMHDISLALEIADEIFVMKDGKVITRASPKEIKESSNPDVVELIKAK